MVLVHANRQMRIHLNRSTNKVCENDVVGECPRPTAGLHNDRAVRFVGRFHDGQHLFHIIDVKCREAVVMLGGVIKKLAKGNQGHFKRSIAAQRARKIEESGSRGLWLALAVISLQNGYFLFRTKDHGNTLMMRVGLHIQNAFGSRRRGTTCLFDNQRHRVGLIHQA